MTQLVAVDYQSPTAKQEFVASLRETGFGVLKNHPLQQSQVESIYRNWHDWFLGDDKWNYKFNGDTLDGLYPMDVSETAKGQTVKDIKEFFHYYPWGVCPPELKNEVHRYRQNALALAAELLVWVEDETPDDVRQLFSMPLPDMMKDSDKTLLRILHYPPLAGDEEPSAIRAAAHEDINLLTVLPAANEPGLQVLGKDGQWLDVPSDFGNLIINIGDMLQEASGGYYPSTTHRVINPDGMDKTKARISLPLFCAPRPEVKLSERHTAETYLTERLRELGHIK